MRLILGKAPRTTFFKEIVEPKNFQFRKVLYGKFADLKANHSNPGGIQRNLVPMVNFLNNNKKKTFYEISVSLQPR